MNSAILQPGAASGKTSDGASKISRENQMMRADPIRRASDAASMPPAIPPRLPSAVARPATAGRMCRTRMRNSRFRAISIAMNRFPAAAQAVILRRTG